MRYLAILILISLLLAPVPAFALKVEVEVPGNAKGAGPELLMDGDPTTAWASRDNAGSDQWIELHFQIPTQVERLGFFNGHQAVGQFEQFRRIRSGRIIYPDGTESRFWLRDEKGEQIVHCPGAAITSLRIEIDSVSPGDKDAFIGNLAVSDIRLYVSVTPPSEGQVKDIDTLNQVRTHLSEDPERAVPPEVAQLLRKFYYRQATLADDYAELFAEDVRDKNDFQFEVFKEMQRQRGTYRLLRSASVNASGLGFEKVEEAGGYIRVRVFGTYKIWAGDLDRQLEEDSIFVIAKEHDGWKIVELEEE